MIFRVSLPFMIPLLILVSILSGQAGKWQRAAKMPTSRSEIAAALHDGLVYVAGEVSLRGSLAAFECYCIRTDTWQRLAPLPVGLNHVGIAAKGNTIYVSGGYADLRQKHVSDQLLAYDIRDDRWRVLSQMPAPRAKHSMIERDGWLHLIGGIQHRAIWSYHIASGRWQQDYLPPLPAHRDHLSPLQDAHAIYIIGGRRDESHEISACLRWRPGTSHWQTITQLPTERGGQVAAIHNGCIYVAGGEDLQTKATYASHDRYDLLTGKWSAATPLPVARHGSASAWTSDGWLVIGGGRQSHYRTLISTSRRVDLYRW